MGSRLSVSSFHLSREVALANSTFQCDNFEYDVHPRRCSSTGNMWTTASQAASASTVEIDGA